MKHTVKLLPNYTAVEKIGVDAKINTLESEGKCSPNTNIPVVPNIPHRSYRQAIADTESDKIDFGQPI